MARENYERGMPAGFLYCSGRGMLHDRVLALRRANIYEPHYYRHMVSGTRLVRQESPGWRFHTNFQVIRTMKTGEMAVFAVGLFDDLNVASETQVLFKAKTVVCDSSRIDTLLVPCAVITPRVLSTAGLRISQSVSFWCKSTESVSDDN